jgi:hypothetical protein
LAKLLDIDEMATDTEWVYQYPRQSREKQVESSDLISKILKKYIFSIIQIIWLVAKYIEVL